MTEIFACHINPILALPKPYCTKLHVIFWDLGIFDRQGIDVNTPYILWALCRSTIMKFNVATELRIAYRSSSTDQFLVHLEWEKDLMSLGTSDL